MSDLIGIKISMNYGHTKSQTIEKSLIEYTYEEMVEYLKEAGTKSNNKEEENHEYEL